MKRSKKAKIKVDKIESKIYSVTCPHCHAKLTGGTDSYTNTLMFECWWCHNPIDLRGKDGKRSYE